MKKSIVLSLGLTGLFAGGFVHSSVKAEEATVSMYRVYNPNSGEHFYTSNASETQNLVNLGWGFEGVGWFAPTGGEEVYRLYNPNNGDHHYTLSTRERDSLVAIGWRYEGISWKSSGTLPLYRLYNPNATGAGSHHYTLLEGERDSLVSLGWKYEGVAWNAVGKGLSAEEYLQVLDDIQLKPVVTPSSTPATPPTPSPTQPVSTPEQSTAYYKNCDEVRRAGKAPIHRGEPGYAPHLDRNGDGVGCEAN